MVRGGRRLLTVSVWLSFQGIKGEGGDRRSLHRTRGASPGGEVGGYLGAEGARKSMSWGVGGGGGNGGCGPAEAEERR